MAENKSETVVAAKPLLSQEELAGISSFDDALALLVDKSGKGGVQLASEVLGDGFKVLQDKDKLIGVPLLFVAWDFHMGDYGEFVAARVVTQSGEKYVVMDGSTGIRDQLMQYSAKFNSRSGLLVQNGLRKSEYTYQDDKTGKETPATTFYIDVSA